VRRNPYRLWCRLGRSSGIRMLPVIVLRYTKEASALCCTIFSCRQGESHAPNVRITALPQGEVQPAEARDPLSLCARGSRHVDIDSTSTGFERDRVRT